jgi:hypothetical protein
MLFPPELKQFWRQADHPPSFTVGLKNGGSLPPLTPFPLLSRVESVKHKDNYTYTEYFCGLGLIRLFHIIIY